MKHRMKIIIVVIVVLLLIVVARIYSVHKNFDDNLQLSVIKHEIFGKYQFTEYTSKFGITRYTSATHLVAEIKGKQGRAFVIKMNGDEVEYVDTVNNKVLAKYPYIGSFEDNGIALIRNKEGRYGFINDKGETIAEPQYLDKFYFIDGLAYVRFYSGKDCKYGFINEKNEFVLEIDSRESLSYYSNNLATAKGSNGLYGYVDITGKFIIEPQFIGASSFGLNEGNSALVQDTNKRWGIINKSGEYVMEPKYTELEYSYDNTLIFKSDEGLYGYIDTNGNVIAEAQFLYAGKFVDGFAKVQDKNGIWKYIKDENYKSSSKSTPQYYNGIARIRDENGLYSYISTSEQGDINEKFLEADLYFENGASNVQRLDGKWGKINEKGEYVLSPIYYEPVNFYYDNLAIAKISPSKYAIINKVGEISRDMSEFDVVEYLKYCILAYANIYDKDAKVMKVYTVKDGTELIEIPFETLEGDYYIRIKVKIDDNTTYECYKKTSSDDWTYLKV